MLFGILFYVFPTFSQLLPGNNTIDFAPVGAKWFYSVTINENTSGNPIIGYVKYESVKDTIIRELIFDRNCRIITATLFSPIAEPISWGREIVYSSGEQIFYFDDGRFYKLFDYSLAAGSTLTVRSSSFRGLFQHRNNLFDKFEYKIDSVKTQTIQGVSFKVQYPSITQNATTESWYLVNGFAKENENIPVFANKGNFFGGLGVKATNELQTGDFRCYTDKNMQINQTDKPCDFMSAGVITSVLNKDKKQSVWHYTNGNDLIINYPELDMNKITIYSLSGTTILEAPISSNAFILNKNQLKSGVYVAKLIGKEHVYQFKFMVE